MSAQHLIGTLVLAAALTVSGCSTPGEPAPEPSPDASGTTASYSRYVALGDSYSAGSGIPVTGPTPCFRSDAGYPALLAEQLGAELDDRTCGGATVGHLAQPQTAEIEPQITAVDTHTDLVTVGVGLNPDLLAALVFGCRGMAASDPEGAPCKEAILKKGSDGVLAQVRQRRVPLTAALVAITRRAPEARVVVVGYPAIIPRDGSSCPDLPLATGDVRYADQVMRALNDELAAAAEEAHVEYLDLADASAEHALCTDDPWFEGEHPRKDRWPYHPVEAQQEQAAQLLADLLTTR